MRESSQTAEVVLVTGSSSGIGEACCKRLNRNRLVYGASRTDTKRKGWSYVKMDVTDEESVIAAVNSIMLREGRIDAVIHCAGLSLAGPVEETTCDEAVKHFETNYFGTVRVVTAVLPIMRRQASGKIIIIGSIGGLIGLPYVGHYSATKFALDGLAEALWHEVQPFGIHVSVVHPGDINTPIGEHRIFRQIASPDSDYRSAFEKATESYAAAEKRARGPEMIARKIESILGRKRPRMRYVVGTPLEVLGVWAKNALPSEAFAYFFRKFYLP